MDQLVFPPLTIPGLIFQLHELASLAACLHAVDTDTCGKARKLSCSLQPLSNTFCAPAPGQSDCPQRRNQMICCMNRGGVDKKCNLEGNCLQRVKYIRRGLATERQRRLIRDSLPLRLAYSACRVGERSWRKIRSAGLRETDLRSTFG